MKAFVISSVPETMLALLLTEGELDRIVFATNPTASEKLHDLGIKHDSIWAKKWYTQKEIDSLGYAVCKTEIGVASTVNGYNVVNGMYPDRLRFWFDPNMIETHMLIENLRHCDEVFIESNLHDSRSWAIAKIFRARGSTVILVKSDENIYGAEFRYIDHLPFDKIAVSHSRDKIYLASITKKEVYLIDAHWDSPERPVTPKANITSLRNQLNIGEENITGVVYNPHDDWKLLALFKGNEINNYILFFNPRDRGRFYKSVPFEVRSSSLHNFDSLSLAGACNEIYFPRFMPECDTIPSHVDIVLYDYNNINQSKEILEGGVI